MRIVPYDEIVDPHDFLQLMMAGFWWQVTPERVAEIRRIDPRFREPYGFGAYVGRTLAGFVGTIDLLVRTRDGRTETALGIHHVATRPEFCRQGIAIRLFEHVHNVYRKRGCRFSFLNTARTLVAWSLYRKLGYADLSRPQGASLLLPKAKASKRKASTTAADLHRVETMFESVMRGRPGVTVRLPGWPRSRLRRWRLKPASLIVERDGYAFTEPEKDGIWMGELVADSRAAIDRILDRVMAQGKRIITVSDADDPVLKSALRERGFAFSPRSHGSLMAKPLGSTPLHTAFGPRFYYSAVDSF